MRCKITSANALQKHTKELPLTGHDPWAQMLTFWNALKVENECVATDSLWARRFNMKRSECPSKWKCRYLWDLIAEVCRRSTLQTANEHVPVDGSWVSRTLNVSLVIVCELWKAVSTFWNTLQKSHIVTFLPRRLDKNTHTRLIRTLRGEREKKSTVRTTCKVSEQIASTT